jgi:hypothetical protein
VNASSLVSSLGFLRGKPYPWAQAEPLSDDDYLARGKTANERELAAANGSPLFRLLAEDEACTALIEVPFGLKHVKDLHVVMRHAVAVAGERREDLARNSLFHPVFAGFALGFSLGLAQAHRLKHSGTRSSFARLARGQVSLWNQWGVEVATYYLACIAAAGIFGKQADEELYGIADRWRLLADEARLALFEELKECVAAGKKAAHRWSVDETADVPPYFLDALANFVQAYPDRTFD